MDRNHGKNSTPFIEHNVVVITALLKHLNKIHTLTSHSFKSVMNEILFIISLSCYSQRQRRTDRYEKLIGTFCNFQFQNRLWKPCRAISSYIIQNTKGNTGSLYFCYTALPAIQCGKARKYNVFISETTKYRTLPVFL